MKALAVVLALLTFPHLAVAKKKNAGGGTQAAKSSAKSTPKAPRDALLAAADEIARQVSGLRGLTLVKPLQRGVLSRDEIGVKLKERIGKEYTPEEMRIEARVLKRLGLLAPDADYEKIILDLLMEQVAGFYDPFASKLYIADWLPLEMQRPAMAHEIEHALQDQHFDLKKYASPIKEDGDRQLAHAALVEGDGTAVMLEFQAQAMGLPTEQLPMLIDQVGKQMLQGGFGQSPQFDKSPTFVKETLIFPYLSGLKFIEKLRAGAPWSRIDEVFKDPPESTEQVLHPEKYQAKEHPVKITPAPLASLPGKKEVRRDVFGELVIQILFATAPLPPEKPAPGPAKKGPPPTPTPQSVESPAELIAEKAAAGWGGDREVAYQDPATPDAAPVVVNLSVWDTEGDAKEAAEVAGRLLDKLGGDKSEDWLVTREGDRVAMVLGAPKGSGAAVAAEMLKTWKIAR